MAVLVAMLGVVTFAAPADAFYWYGWPGGPKPPKTVTPPPEEPPPEEPPPKEPPPTTVTPEPGTAMAALIGLGALAAWRRTRRQVIETPTSTS
ncbi:MAG TPA: PEP-CTERM sorting domain-containing protein [Gemmata sp.]|jgi:MYXO-CTERM domain-containing protein|nr:PEP-CTERM sorting domain-containing protein [Gemmata sp.]